MYFCEQSVLQSKAPAVQEARLDQSEDNTPDALDCAIEGESFCHFLHVKAYALASTRKLI